jgi:hypothetical protein
MMQVGAKTAPELFLGQGVQKRPEPLLFLWLVAVAVKDFAALDGVGDVLGHIAHFGEFRPVGSTGDMGVDKPGRDQPKEVESMFFGVRGIMRGLLPSEGHVRVSERGLPFGERDPESGQLGLQGYGFRLKSKRALSPLKSLFMKQVCLVEVVIGVCAEFLNQLFELSDIRLIDLNGKLTTKHAIHDLAVGARGLCFRAAALVSKCVSQNSGTLLVLRFPRPTTHVGGGLQSRVHTKTLILSCSRLIVATLRIRP